MKIHNLIRYSALTEATKCGIYNTLLKFRPDLKGEMDSIPGGDVKASVGFLKEKGLWDDDAQTYLNNMLRAMIQRQRFGSPPGTFEYREDTKPIIQWQETLMCHIAKLIRSSASAS